MTEPRLSDYLRHYAEDGRLFDYHAVSDPAREHAYARLHEAVIDALRSLPRGARVLDVGSGGGHLVGALSRRGLKATAADVSIRSLAQVARVWREVRVAAGDGYALPFKDGCFSAVVMTEVLEHLERPEDAVREARRVLVPGGAFVVTVPYREPVVYYLCVHCNRPTPAHAHLREYDETVLRTHLGRWGSIETRVVVQRHLDVIVRLLRMERLPRVVWRVLDRCAIALRGRARFLVGVAVKDGAP